MNKTNFSKLVTIATVVLMSATAWAQSPTGAVLTGAVEAAGKSAIAAAAPKPFSDPGAVALRQTLKQRYPNTTFGDIERTPMPGVWEIWMGSNVAYVTDDGRHFIFGHLYDMQTQTDLTAGKKEALTIQEEVSKPKLAFADLPLADAIKVVRGTGERQVAVFADPDCPYCKRLDDELDKLDNVTVYTFLYPIASLHPEAGGISHAIWCASDRAAAWKQYLASQKVPASKQCASPVERNVKLATGAGINGTPFILFANGQRAAGALDVSSLERYLTTVSK